MLVSVVKMVTVLEDFTTEELRSDVRFCGQKDTMQRIFIKECFLFTVGSVCRVKRFAAGSKTETTVKRLLCCGFRRTSKTMGHVYQCWWRICREINVFFFRFEYDFVLRFNPFVTYLLALIGWLVGNAFGKGLTGSDCNLF
jgi:hypothetical protein